MHLSQTEERKSSNSVMNSAANVFHSVFSVCLTMLKCWSVDIPGTLIALGSKSETKSSV